MDFWQVTNEWMNQSVTCAILHMLSHLKIYRVFIKKVVCGRGKKILFYESPCIRRSVITFLPEVLLPIRRTSSTAHTCEMGHSNSKGKISSEDLQFLLKNTNKRKEEIMVTIMGEVHSTHVENKKRCQLGPCTWPFPHNTDSRLLELWALVQSYSYN